MRRVRENGEGKGMNAGEIARWLRAGGLLVEVSSGEMMEPAARHLKRVEGLEFAGYPQCGDRGCAELKRSGGLDLVNVDWLPDGTKILIYSEAARVPAVKRGRG